MLSSFHLYFPSISSFNLENLPSDLPSSKLQNWKIFLQIFQFPCLQPGKSSFYLPSSNLENLPSTFHLPSKFQTWKIFLLHLPSLEPGNSSFYFPSSKLPTWKSFLPSLQPEKSSFGASNFQVFNLPSDLPSSIYISCLFDQPICPISARAPRSVPPFVPEPTLAHDILFFGTKLVPRIQKY